MIKHQPGVRCCGRRAGLFCYCSAATGGKLLGSKVGEGQAGSGLALGGAAAPGLARFRINPPIHDTAYYPTQKKEKPYNLS